MTIKELYEVAKERGIEDKEIELVGITEAGWSVVLDTRFFMKEKEDRVDLIVTETTGEEEIPNVHIFPEELKGAEPLF